jgi:hypothetical protein
MKDQKPEAEERAAGDAGAGRLMPATLARSTTDEP